MHYLLNSLLKRIRSTEMYLGVKDLKYIKLSSQLLVTCELK